MPVEVAGAADSITIGPKTAFAGGAVAGIEIIDGGFVDLKFAGLEDFLADGLIDGGEVPSGGVSPSVEGLPPDVDVVPSSGALGLPVVGKVILILVGDDLGGECRCQKGAGDRGKRGCLLYTSDAADE